jgi:hypothetical protein
MQLGCGGNRTGVITWHHDSGMNFFPLSLLTNRLVVRLFD